MISNSTAAPAYISPFMTIQFCVEVCRGAGQPVAAAQVGALLYLQSYDDLGGTK